MYKLLMYSSIICVSCGENLRVTPFFMVIATLQKCGESDSRWIALDINLLHNYNYIRTLSSSQDCDVLSGVLKMCIG